jgi:tetratricopeptide (TPR) repeat protein
MAETDTSLEQARKLIRGAAYLPAEQTLSELLSESPDDPAANAVAGILYCLTQREELAPPLLAKAWPKGSEPQSEDARHLAQILVDYIHCRKLMAAKLGIKDALGPRMEAAVRKVADIQPSEDVGITLSACMIVKNEEKHLQRCLKSIQGLVDELVVVDTGSTDRTVEIAETYGAKLGYFEWCDDFSAARNESLRLASGHWALWIDADEELDPESWSAIREGIIRPQYGGHFISIVNYMSEDNEADQYVHCPVRLFRHLPEIRFVSRIHEQIMPSIIEMGLPFANLGRARIYHYGYQAASMNEKNKLDRTITMLEREVRDYPEDPFHWFNLTNAYAAGARHREVVRCGRVCLQKLEPGNRYGSLAYHLLMIALTALGRNAEALAYYDEAVIRGFEGILVEFGRAQALLESGRLDEALASVDNCLKMEWPERTTGDYGIVTHKTHTLKGKILLKMGRFDEALQLFEYALSVDPTFSIALQGRGLALEAMGRLDDALSAFQAGLELKGIEHVARKNCARVVFKLGRHAEAASLFEAAWRAQPTDNDAWVGWVRACEAGGDVARVVQAYSAYASARGPSVDMLIGWGRALDAAGEPDRALHCFTEAIKRDPGSANAYFNSGDLLYRQRQFADAAHLYEQGLRLQPENAQGWFVLGNSLARLGLADGAVSALRQTLRINPQHTDARHNLDLILGTLQPAA